MLYHSASSRVFHNLQSMMNLLIADDHQLFIDGLQFMFSSRPEYRVIATVNNGQAAVARCAEGDIEAVLMDINMPELNGLEATKLIKAANANIKILIVSMLDDYASINKLLKAGADGYVLKNAGADELITALAALQQGEIYVSDELQKGLFKFNLKKTPPPPASRYTLNPIDDISTREREILQLISEGLTNNEMAAKLFLSPKTIDTHRTNLLQKLGLKNTAALVRFAVENGLID
jgi:two-component system, NarL family, nitrate/nitrite response regulator NarL